jgi:hypothetical protein
MRRGAISFKISWQVAANKISRCLYNFYNRHQVTSLISLINILVSDLLLNRPFIQEVPHVIDKVVRDTCGTLAPCTPPRTLEEQRAFLGAFYITSVYVFNALLGPIVLTRAACPCTSVALNPYPTRHGSTNVAKI